MMFLAWLWTLVEAWFARRLQNRYGGRRRSITPVYCRTQSKPPWVTKEIIRLKALMPGVSCRELANIFNRRFAVSRRMTVEKTCVADKIRKHRHEIEIERRRIKHRVPPALPRNLVWGLDLTGKTDSQGKLHMILGLLDHGSRGLLTLAALPDKCSWTLLGHLFLAIGKYGKPRAVRTDNEACFTSRMFRIVLALAGIGLPVAERTHRTIVRDVEAETQSMGGGGVRSVESFARRIQVLLQQRQAASAFARRNACRSLGAGQSIR